MLLAWLVLTGWCYRRPLSQRFERQTRPTTQPVWLAYASETGHARSLAELCQQQLQQQGRPVQLLPLNQLSAALAAQQGMAPVTVLLFVSTTGEGDAPANGSRFLSTLAQTSWTGVQYAVLALGDRQYPHYCRFGLLVHEALQQAGARALFEAMCVDDLNAGDIARFHEQLALSMSLQSLNQNHCSHSSPLIFDYPLIARQQLNDGSPGDGIFELTFGVPDDQPLARQWQAGDIARLHLQDEHGQPLHRDYTIASLADEGRLQLLVRQQFRHRGENSQLGYGSGLLTHTIQAAQQARFEIIHNPNFHAPASHIPMILIGNGTGLAGLRAHIRQRLIPGCRNWLIFGERSAEHDALYQQELARWLEDGVLGQLDLAFSRTSAAHLAMNTALCGELTHGYVQHVIERRIGLLKEWIDNGACLYVCGSQAGMATDVDRALRQELGDELVDRLDLEGRYRRDVY
ncbi:NADPH cytochrome P450 oxidoreductase family protein [Oceanobacter mangrovi]|uniref:NADPH cytochrome P450 oxidoreductase family protein n=1 Tax=Oceanobacter mangrovi TaxID=2862510 RepID=UPI001C8EE58F|nr:NADPH cytochrome P450 oxidoreductase family protein [Oceanobacter mangrovi]